MIKTDTIIINSTLVPVHVLTYYEGIKEEVDMTNHTIFLWYDEQDSFELWLKIKSDSPSTLSAYLSNKAGIMDVIKSSSVELYKRSFDNYNELHKYSCPDEIEFPENERLGQDFLSMLNAKRTLNTITQDNLSQHSNNVVFKNPYTSWNKMVETTITSSNDEVFNYNYYDLLAA